MKYFLKAFANDLVRNTNPSDLILASVVMRWAIALYGKIKFWKVKVNRSKVSSLFTIVRGLELNVLMSKVWGHQQLVNKFMASRQFVVLISEERVLDKLFINLIHELN
jgi:hypothetical protein